MPAIAISKSRITLLLVLFTVCHVVYSCEESQNNGATTSAGIEYLLNECQQSSSATGGVLYTWGHQQKLDRLLEQGYPLFSRFNNAQQFTYAGFKARALLSGAQRNPAFIEFTTLLKRAIGTLTVGELYRATYGQDQKDIDLRISARKIFSSYCLANEGACESLTLEPEVYALLAIKAIAIDNVNPGFIETLRYSGAEFKALLEQMLAEQQAVPDQAFIEGQLLGVTRAMDTSSANRDSNISYGPGLYFADKPSTNLNHYAPNHYGLACKLGKRDRFYNLETVREQMLSQAIYLSSASVSQDNTDVAVAWPTNYNQLSDPVGFRDQTRGKLLKFRHIYVDRGVIQYTVPNVCKPIQLSDFKSCDDIARLLDEAYFRLAKNTDDSLFNKLTQSNQKQQVDNFIYQLRSCLNQQSNHPKQTGSVCRALRTQQKDNSYVYQQIRNQSFLDTTIEKYINQHCKV